MQDYAAKYKGFESQDLGSSFSTQLREHKKRSLLRDHLEDKSIR